MVGEKIGFLLGVGHRNVLRGMGTQRSVDWENICWKDEYWATTSKLNGLLRGDLTSKQMSTMGIQKM